MESNGGNSNRLPFRDRMPTPLAYQHAAKLVPVDLSAIDDQQRQLAVMGVVPLDPAAHDPTVGDLQAIVAVLEMFD